MTHLTINNVSKQYGNSFAVQNFNLDIKKGEFVSFLGPSGCGKTTTLRMVAGFEIPTAGNIILDDEDITYKAPNQRNVGMVFQAYALFPNMTVSQNIGFGLRIHQEKQSAINERVNEMLSLIHLESHADKYPYQLSGGQQQRVSLARALAIRPKVLLLDEPLSALDAKIRISLRSEIRAIQKKLGITAIFVTHDQEEALSLADRIAVMNAGHLEQLDVPSQIYAHPRTLFVADFIGVMNIFSTRRDGNLLRIGRYALHAPTVLNGGDKLNIAVRPEDLLVVQPDQVTDPSLLWQGTIDQSIDLGHYRKVLVVVPGLFPDGTADVSRRVKMYTQKSSGDKEGDQVWLYPARYLVYADNAEPIEVHNQPLRTSNESRGDNQNQSILSSGEKDNLD